MSIGTFGPITFEVSREKTRTFDEFNRKTSAKFEQHDIIGQKAKLEFISPGLDEISFQVIFSAFHGLNPLNETKQLRSIVQNGEFYSLIIGGKSLGFFVIENISEAWKYVDNKGNVLYIAVNVNLKEYYMDPEEAEKYETADTAALQAEKADTVAAEVEAQAQQTGLSAQDIADITSTVVNCVRDPSLAIDGLQSILTATQTLQSGSFTSAASDSYIRMGLDTADLTNRALKDPKGTVLDVINTLGNSTAVNKPELAKSIYGARSAGTILLMAEQLKG